MKARTVLLAGILTLAAGSAWAQDQPIDHPQNGFVEGLGAVTFASGVDSGALGVNLGFRIAPHVFITGGFGRLRDVNSGSFNDTVNQTVNQAAASDITVTTLVRAPVTYALGGLRVETPTIGRRITPFVSGSFGVARLTPTASFLYASGAGNGQLSTMPNVGDNVTSQLVGLGYYASPVSENHPMLGLGGGVDLILTRNVNLNLAYRYSRIFATNPINVSGPSFAVGFRF
jgi:opacity protein-like surface antigen